MHFSRAITAVAGCTKVGKYQSLKEAIMTNHHRTNSMTMTGPRAAASLACATAFVGASVLSATLAMPVASADTLPNGLTVSCNQDSDIHATCIVGGCPRVNGDHVVDAVHVKVNGGGQSEASFKCINGETHREGVDNNRNPINVGVQACRKNTGLGEHDDCTPYANYTFTPPGKPAAPVAPAGPVAPVVPVVPVVPVAPVEQAPTNAISLSFQRQGLSEVASFKNSSKVPGQCHYKAVDANGLLPAKVDDFSIGPNATVTRTYPAPPLLDTYNASVTCHGDFNGKDVELGTASQSVTG
jgi:hypothetical protein